MQLGQHLVRGFILKRRWAFHRFAAKPDMGGLGNGGGADFLETTFLDHRGFEQQLLIKGFLLGHTGRRAGLVVIDQNIAIFRPVDPVGKSHKGKAQIGERVTALGGFFKSGGGGIALSMQLVFDEPIGNPFDLGQPHEARGGPGGFGL